MQAPVRAECGPRIPKNAQPFLLMFIRKLSISFIVICNNHQYVVLDIQLISYIFDLLFHLQTKLKLMKQKVRHTLFVVLLFISSQSFSQSVTPATLNATGGTNFFTFYRFEWSIGEAAAIETMSSGNIVVTNGILQPGTNNPADNNVASAWGPEEIKVLPNPVRDQMEIDFFSKQQGAVTMNLYDESGRLLESRQITYNGTGLIYSWNLGRYPGAQYFLKIQLVPTGTSVAKKGTYKIIKIK